MEVVLNLDPKNSELGAVIVDSLIASGFGLSKMIEIQKSFTTSLNDKVLNEVRVSQEMIDEGKDYLNSQS